MDQVQRTSSVPLPTFQTVEGGQDPLPVGSPRLREQSAAQQSERDLAAQSDAFKTYLDQSSVTMVEDVAKKKRPDGADLISQGSIYTAPGLPVGV